MLRTVPNVQAVQPLPSVQTVEDVMVEGGRTTVVIVGRRKDVDMDEKGTIVFRDGMIRRNANRQPASPVTPGRESRSCFHAAFMRHTARKA